MKITARKRIEEFVELMMYEKAARAITDQWPLESVEICRVIVEHFHVMGIYFVEPMAGSKLIEDNIIRVLKTSPELQELVRKGRQVQETGRKAKVAEQ